MGDEPTSDDIAKEFRRTGPPDQALADAGLVFAPAEDILKLGSEGVWGSDKPSQLLKTLRDLASPYLSEKGQEAFGAFLEGLEPYVRIAGLFGNPDEIERSGLEELARVGPPELQKARRLYQFVIAGSVCADRGAEFLPDVPPVLNTQLSRIARTLAESDEWCIVGLAAAAIAASRVSGAADAQPNPRAG
jgi:hypothetical protein